jgi:hypothetical protein
VTAAPPGCPATAARQTDAFSPADTNAADVVAKDGSSPDGTTEPMPISCLDDPCSGKVADGCCPAKCTAATDVDCAGCGNGKVEAALGETCEGAGCPTSCAPMLCAKVTITGTAAACNAKCVAEPITTCSLVSDNCCPTGTGGAALCSATDDIDCRAVCGNNKVEPGETCDPVSDCTTKKTACVSDANMIRTQSGDPAKCTFSCAVTARNCVDGDGFCPTACGPTTDTDCVGCGNGKVEAGETCDPLTSCQQKKSACVSDVNTVRKETGDATKCTFACVESSRGCVANDTFCPTGCGPATDNDCAGCGNGKVETSLGETCEGAGCPATCPTALCMKVTRTGAANTCNVKCTSVAITACSLTADNCCPSGCTANNDADCGAVCGNGTVEGGETCDPLSDCTARKNACVSDANKIRLQSGDATKCTFECVEADRNCVAGDNFCPSRCAPTTDSDCPGCGNGKTEAGETCDPVSQCQARQLACTSDANTVRTSAGDPTKCTYSCNESARPCTTGDGYCPNACGPTNDYDCPGCGNGKTETGETCDGSNCQPIINGCNGDANYVRTISGTAGACNVACNATPRTCGPSDGYCPSGCAYPTDADCPECTNGDSQACPTDPSNVIVCANGRWPARPTPCPGACPTSVNDAWSPSKPLGYGTAPWRIIWPPESSSAAKPTNAVTGRVDFPWDSVIQRDALSGSYVLTFTVAIDPVADFAVQVSPGTGPFPAIRRLGSSLRMGGIAYGNGNSFTTYGGWTDQVIDFTYATVTLYIKAGAKQLAAWETSSSTARGTGFLSPSGFNPPQLVLAGSNSLDFYANKALLHGMVGNIKGCAGLTDGQVDYYYQQKKTYP